jgi:phenylacetate-CoA ligase
MRDLLWIWSERKASSSEAVLPGNHYTKEASQSTAWPARDGDKMLHRIVWDYLTVRRSHRLRGRELAELQGWKLRSLVHHAYRTVPFYHDAFVKRAITPDRIRSAEQLRLLPVLTRQDIQDNYPHRMLSSRRSTAGTVIRHTSGTIGRPLEIAWDKEDCDRNTARHLVMAQSLGLSFLDKTVDILYLGPEKPEPSKTPEMSRLRKILIGPIATPMIFTLRSRKTGFRRSVLEVEKELLSLRPAAIYSRPSYMRRLGSHLDREGKKLRVGKILAGGEYLSNSVRKELEGYFDSEVFNGLGAQELGTLGVECREHCGIHLFSDHFAFEFLSDGEPASAGEAAELVITSLYNKTMPLIGYKLGTSLCRNRVLIAPAASVFQSCVRSEVGRTTAWSCPMERGFLLDR